MNFSQITISSIPWQEFSVILDGQNCVIAIRQLGDCLYMDLTADGNEIFKCRKATLTMPMNCFKDANFSGYLFWMDTRGNELPQYEGLNDRWILCYMTEDQLVEYLESIDSAYNSLLITY